MTPSSASPAAMETVSYEHAPGPVTVDLSVTGPQDIIVEGRSTQALDVDQRIPACPIHVLRGPLQ